MVTLIEQNKVQTFKNGDKLVSIRRINYGNVDDLGIDVPNKFIVNDKIVFNAGTKFTLISLSGPGGGWPELIPEGMKDSLDFTVDQEDLCKYFKKIK